MQRLTSRAAAVLLCFAMVALVCKEASADLAFADPQAEKLVRRLAADVREGKLIEVTNVALSREYSSNEVVADNKYKDRYLLVAATVESVQKDAFGSIVLRLRAANQFLPTMASFDKSVAVVSGLKRGNKVVSMRTVSGAEAAAAVNRGSSIKVLCKAKGLLIGSVQLAVCDVLYL